MPCDVLLICNLAVSHLLIRCYVHDLQSIPIIQGYLTLCAAVSLRLFYLQPVELVDLERQRLALDHQRIKRVGDYLWGNGGIGRGAEDDLVGGAGLKSLGDVDCVANGRVVLQTLARTDIADDRQPRMHADAIVD